MADNNAVITMDSNQNIMSHKSYIDPTLGSFIYIDESAENIQQIPPHELKTVANSSQPILIIPDYQFHDTKPQNVDNKQNIQVNAMRSSAKQPDQIPNPLENSIVEELTARFMSLSARPLSTVKKSSPIAILYAVDDNTLELSKTVNSIAELARIDTIKDIYDALKKRFSNLDQLIEQAKLAVALIDEWENKYQHSTSSQSSSQSRSNSNNESQKSNGEASNVQQQLQPAEVKPDVPVQNNVIEPFDIVIKNDVVELDEPQIVHKEEPKPAPVEEAPKVASVNEYPIENVLGIDLQSLAYLQAHAYITTANELAQFADDYPGMYLVILETGMIKHLDLYIANAKALIKGEKQPHDLLLPEVKILVKPNVAIETLGLDAYVDILQNVNEYELHVLRNSDEYVVMTVEDLTTLEKHTADYKRVKQEVHGIDALIKNATTVLHYLKNRVIASQK
jgi:hypothetical protein